jgi:hypothetical protein
VETEALKETEKMRRREEADKRAQIEQDKRKTPRHEINFFALDGKHQQQPVYPLYLRSANTLADTAKDRIIK